LPDGRAKIEVASKWKFVEYKEIEF
jgi:hypothetical protein